MERRRAVGAVVLLLAGAGLWVFVARPAMGPSGRTWETQIAQDAVPLTQLLRFDLVLEDTAPVEAAWAKRRALYDAAHLAEMARRLSAFVDFQVAEYGDAKDIFVAGQRPEQPSQSARHAHERLRAAFGATADEMIRQFAERVREEAYKASPAVAKGEDPDRPNYEDLYRRVVAERLPQARATIERLTAPPR